MSILLEPTFYYSILRVTTPILLAALAAFITDKAGVINIGIEGIMLMSALFGVLGSAFTSNVWVGLLSAMIAGVLMALLLAYVSLTLKTNIVLAGIALNLVASGLTVFILYIITGNKGNSTDLNSGNLPFINIPLIKDIPILGQIISGHNILTYVAFLLVYVMYVLVYKTPVGLWIRSMGENPRAASSVGISQNKIGYLALGISGLLTGLAGAYMSMAYVSMFTANMTAGRGFIALAAEAMGASSPMATAVTSLIFGTAEATSISISSMGYPPELIRTIPYVVTIVGLVINSIHRGRKQLEKEKKKESV